MTDTDNANGTRNGFPFKVVSVLVIAVALGAVFWISQSSKDSGGGSKSTLEEPVVAGGPATVRRLSESQYKRAITQIFGEEIDVPGRFDPPVREDLLLAIGDSSATVTASGLEQHLLRAEQIAKQVLSEENRGRYLDCKPVGESAFDNACASGFLEKYGRLLLRRPLEEEEKTLALTVAENSTVTFGDFYTGLQYGLMTTMISPSFIYRVETVEPDANGSGQRLDAYALATRLSFFLWDAPPDTELLDVAAGGELHKPEVMQQQVDRMIASPLFVDGVRAFFWDMYGFDQFVGLGKDTELFPRYSVSLRDDAVEQSMRTIIDLLVTQKGAYGDLFTTQTTFVNRTLASLFRVPVSGNSEDGWERVTLAPESHRAGLLTLPAFLMLDTTHEGRSSPTIRGKTVREFMLCHAVPPPPGDVNFDIVENTDSPLRTARERLALHNEDPVCAGCHAVTDPVGLAFENFNPIGEYRAAENGVTIDPSGIFDGRPFEDAVSLQQAMVDSGSVANCVARRAYEYGVGRELASSEYKLMTYLNAAFSETDHNFVDLIRLIATSDAFQRATSDVEVAGLAGSPAGDTL